MLIQKFGFLQHIVVFIKLIVLIFKQIRFLLSFFGMVRYFG